jgi:hypothetical protein
MMILDKMDDEKDEEDRIKEEKRKMLSLKKSIKTNSDFYKRQIKNQLTEMRKMGADPDTI